jgi:plastocyanin
MEVAKMSIQRVSSEDQLQQGGGSDAAFERDPVRRPAGTAGPSHAVAILLSVLIAVFGLVVGYGTAAGSTAARNDIPGVATVLPGTVVIKNFAFGPASLVVAPGTKITVLNQDRAPHTVTAVNKSFDSGTIPGGQRGEFTAPSSPGTYPYICTVHPSMTGALIVK